MNTLITIENVKGYLAQNGTVMLNLEDVARGLGFTEKKNGTEYIRWRTVNGYLEEFGYSQEVAKDDFVPENIFYKLCFKAKNETARDFQDIVTDEILPSIRKNGMYATDITIDKMISDPDFAIRLLINLKEEKQQRLLAEQKAELLSVQLDESKHWYTIKRVAALNRVHWKSLDWRELKAQSQKMNLKVNKIFDANFGEVNTYHEDVWKAVYPELVY